MTKDIIVGTDKRHITNGNCSPPMGGSGSAKPQSGLRPLCGFATPHFAVAGLCFAKPLFATAKRQLPRTLSEIRARLSEYENSQYYSLYG